MAWTSNSRSRANGAIAPRWIGVFAMFVLGIAAGDPLNGTFEIRNAAIEHDEQGYRLSAQIELPVDDEELRSDAIDDSFFR